MDTYESRRKRQVSRARERQMARQRRKEAMAVPRQGQRENENTVPDHIEREVTLPQRLLTGLRRASLIVRDALWYARNDVTIMKAIAVVVLIGALFFVGSHVFGGKIFPNVYAMGVHVGGLTVEDAELALLEAWSNDIEIELVAEGEVINRVSPAALGLSIDASSAVEAARAVGMAGIPAGYNVEAPIAVEFITVEEFLFASANEINTLPYNAGYAWENGQVVGVPGEYGRELDIMQTLSQVEENPAAIIQRRRLDLLTLAIEPDFVDPTPLLDTVETLVQDNFQLIGYDPLLDTTEIWSTSRQHFTSWLETGPGRLRIREDAFREYINALNDAIATTEPNKFIDMEEATEALEQAIANDQSRADLRKRYRTETYTVQSGDTGFLISRKVGVPFHIVSDLNFGVDWGQLSIGQEINLPPRDANLALPPVRNKRIIVDLERQLLVAFEDNEQVFSWEISSGIDRFPTLPGTFQILSHTELALGSSFELCAEGGGDCGQWKMSWFMGIYEVGGGVMNGFHGAVELPNGGYLNGGSVGYPATYGCVMSLDSDAQTLFEWADQGTMVEIISGIYPPQSDLARQVRESSI